MYKIAICDDDIEFMSGLERFVKDYCTRNHILVKIDTFSESGGMLEVIPEKQNAVELEITPFDSKKKRTVTLMLENFPKRPEKTTRVRVEISFLDEKTMRIVLTDLGFGELFPATGAKVVQEVML